MSEKRRYLHVQRVKPSDLFLLTRVDPADGQRFHVKEVVAACQQCRCVSRRQYWLERGGACPVCGAETAIPFRSLRNLSGFGKQPVIHSRRRIHMEVVAAIGLMAALFVLISAVLLHQTNQFTHSAGFKATEDGRFYYQDSAERRYMDGSYDINGQTYHFSDGYLDGAYALTVGSQTYLTDDNGRIHTGWSVLDGKYVYTDEHGAVTSRVPSLLADLRQISGDASGSSGTAGFYALDGLGTVFIAAGGQAPSGWVLHDRSLYHFQDGRPAPLEDMPGSFSALGRYVPQEAGFVEVMENTLFLRADGTTGSGLIAHAGNVYPLDEQGILQRVWTRRDVPATLSPATCALIPQNDVQLPCEGGIVTVSARTGTIQTGWLLYEQHVYCTDAQGYLLTNCRAADANGRFTATGRFLPDAAGPFAAGELRCYLLQDGTLATGYLPHNGMLYAYGEDGRLQVNAHVDAIGLLGTDGAFRPYVAGMYQLDDAYYCFDASGKLLTGWQRCGKLYYFDPQTGRRASVGALVDGVAYPLANNGFFAPLTEGVYQLGENAYYVNTNGEVLTGWRAVNGVLTYFDEQTGARRDAAADDHVENGWVQRNNSRFYVLADHSVARGWQIIDGEAYYFDPVTGAVATGLQEIDGTAYTFRQDGLLQPKAPVRLIVEGEPVRIGVKGSVEGGLLYDSGHLYYFDDQTARLAHHLPEGLDGYISVLGGYIIPSQAGVYQAGDAAYYLDLSGNVLTGWFQQQNRLYLADPATGRLHADGYDETWQGSFSQGCFTPAADGYYTADGRSFYFHQGKLTTGWVPLPNGVGYIDDRSGLLLQGVKATIDGIEYSFDANGFYQPGRPVVVSLPNGRFVLNADGTLPMQTGVVFIDGFLMAHTAGGKLAKSPAEAGLNAAAFMVEDGLVKPITAGLCTLDDATYMMNRDGYCSTGLVCYRERLYYFFPETGQMCVNALGHDGQGVYLPPWTGIFHCQGNAYWAVDVSGRIGLGLIDDGYGNCYYANEQGQLVSGRIELSGKQYYFYDAAQNYRMARDCFVHMTTGNNDICYAGADGALVTGWQEINGKLHCFDDNGVMLYDTIKDGRYINLYGEVQ